MNGVGLLCHKHCLIQRNDPAFALRLGGISVYTFSFASSNSTLILWTQDVVHASLSFTLSHEQASVILFPWSKTIGAVFSESMGKQMYYCDSAADLLWSIRWISFFSLRPFSFITDFNSGTCLRYKLNHFGFLNFSLSGILERQGSYTKLIQECCFCEGIRIKPIVHVGWCMLIFS